MLDELQKSIKAILYDRLTSPLAGAFIFSWFVWNWGLVYYILIGDYSLNVVGRIEYIKDNFLGREYIFWYPFVSTVVLIFIYPFFAVQFYQVTLWFNRWKKDIKNKIEREQCLTVEESISIREELSKQVEKYQEINKGKDDDISRLKLKISKYEQDIKDFKQNQNRLVEEYKNKFEILRARYGTSQNQNLIDVTEKLKKYVQNGQLVYTGKYNNIAGDPEKGAHKKLEIIHKANGKIISRLYPEDDPINLP